MTLVTKNLSILKFEVQENTEAEKQTYLLPYTSLYILNSRKSWRDNITARMGFLLCFYVMINMHLRHLIPCLFFNVAFGSEIRLEM